MVSYDIKNGQRRDSTENFLKEKSDQVCFVVGIFHFQVSSVLVDKYFSVAGDRNWLKTANFQEGMEDVMVINKPSNHGEREPNNFRYTEKSASSVVEVVARQKGSKVFLQGPVSQRTVVAATGW
jgi:hypothetical protein